MTNNNERAILPAEWAEQDAIMLAWPHAGTDWSYMLEEVVSCYKEIVNAIADQGERVIVIADPDDSSDISFSNELISVVNSGMFKGEYSNNLNFVLEGGSIESDGKGTLLTTRECLLSKNRNGQSSKEEIQAYLEKVFGISRVLWLDHGYLSGDDTDSHIDTLARLAPNDTILYVSTDDERDEHFTELKAMECQLQSFTTADGAKYKLLPLPLPAPIFADGERLPATYANFLIGNGFVLVPIYGQESNDSEAMSIISSAFPDRKVLGVDCRALIKQHGSLHCVTMQFPKNSLNI